MENKNEHYTSYNRKCGRKMMEVCEFEKLVNYIYERFMGEMTKWEHSGRRDEIWEKPRKSMTVDRSAVLQLELALHSSHGKNAQAQCMLKKVNASSGILMMSHVHFIPLTSISKLFEHK